MAMLALSFNLLFGYMGQMSFGQAAFYGLGGYAVAMLMVKWQFNFWLSIVAGVLLAAFVGLIVGYFCVRLRGIYFAVLTLAFGQLIWTIVFKWHDFTGGDDGIQGVFPPDFLKSPTAYYYLILVVFLASSWVIWKIIHSPFGHTIQAMRENSERTEFLGINIARYQLITFVIAAALAGLAGAVWVPFYRSVAPSYLTWIKSGEPVMAAILGGPSVFLGPVSGHLRHDLLPRLGSGIHRLLARCHGGPDSVHHLLPARRDSGFCNRDVQGEKKKGKHLGKEMNYVS